MIDAARDTEKLFTAKNSLEGLAKPAKGDRKAARKLNDSAITLMGEKKYTEAIPILEDAHKTDPADIEIMNNLGYAYIEKGIVDNDFAKAKQSLVDTLHLKPERAQAWANLGRTFALEGNEAAASNCYINFFRFAENKEKALSRLQSGINETNLVLGKALTNAYNYVKTSNEPTSNSEAGSGE
jgi:Flp pilus assembly protein TadD